jgi:hypothetical protein
MVSVMLMLPRVVDQQAECHQAPTAGFRLRMDAGTCAMELNSNRTFRRFHPVLYSRKKLAPIGPLVVMYLFHEVKFSLVSIRLQD